MVVKSREPSSAFLDQVSSRMPKSRKKRSWRSGELAGSEELKKTDELAKNVEIKVSASEESPMIEKKVEPELVGLSEQIEKRKGAVVAKKSPENSLEPKVVSAIGKEEIGSNVNEDKSNIYQDKLASEVVSLFKTGKFSLREIQVLSAIVDEHRKQLGGRICLSYSDLVAETGLHRPHLPKVIQSLVDKGVILKEIDQASKKNEFRFVL